MIAVCDNIPTDDIMMKNQTFANVTKTDRYHSL